MERREKYNLVLPTGERAYLKILDEKHAIFGTAKSTVQIRASNKKQLAQLLSMATGLSIRIEKLS